jgi:hypothetical protein
LVFLSVTSANAQTVLKPETEYNSGYKSSDGGNPVDREEEIMSYLEKYGNTREEDLVAYLLHSFNCSSGKTKKILHRMVTKGQIHRLVHDKLNPPKVYITLEMQMRAEALKNTAEAGTSVEPRSEAQRILEEAAMIAKKRMQDEAEKGS